MMMIPQQQHGDVFFFHSREEEEEEAFDWLCGVVVASDRIIFSQGWFACDDETQKKQWRR